MCMNAVKSHCISLTVLATTLQKDFNDLRDFRVIDLGSYSPKDFRKKAKLWKGAHHKIR